MPVLDKRNLEMLKLSKVIGHPDFKFDGKLNASDLQLVLEHFVNGTPIEKVRKLLMKEHGLTYQEVTKLVNKMNNMVSDIMRKVKDPTKEEINKISNPRG